MEEVRSTGGGKRSRWEVGDLRVGVRDGKGRGGERLGGGRWWGGGGEVAGRWRGGGGGVVRGEGGDWGRWEIRSWWRWGGRKLYFWPHHTILPSSGSTAGELNN